MLKQIKYFQTVVRCNSFSEAAEKCYISQSAISQQIQSLERTLGVTLLHRQNRRFSLTPAGEHFYRKSLLLTSELERLCQETIRIANGDDLTLRIGYSKGYGGLEFQKAVAEFTTKHPEISVDIKNGNHETLYDLMRMEQVDLVLNDQRRAFSDEYVNLILTTIGCDIEISSRNPISALPYVSVDDLRQTPCILIASKEQQETEQKHYQEIYGINSEFLFAEDLEEARLMVLSGKGFLPIEGGESPSQYAKTLVRRPLCRAEKPIRRNYCAFWKVAHSNYYIEEFAEILKKQFETDTLSC